MLPQEPLPPGFHLFRVQVEASADTYIQNNEGGSYTVVTGKPRVLLIESEGGETRFLAEALQSAGLEVDVRSTQTAVIDLPTLRGYESVVLANVPAADLSATQMRAITSYVQNLGGGLVVVGGEQSYGVGPVQPDAAGRGAAGPDGPAGPDADGQRGAGAGDRRLREHGRRPGLLEDGPGEGGGDPRHRAAERAGSAWRDLVRRHAALGGPDGVPGGPGAAQAQIGSIAPGGGTAIFPALEAAYNDISTREAKVRHILLLTDGLSSGGDYDRLTAADAATGDHALDDRGRARTRTSR